MFQTPQGTRNVRSASPSGGLKQSQFSMRNNNNNNNNNNNLQQIQQTNSSSSKTSKLPKLLNEEKGTNQDNLVIDVGVCSLQGRRPYQEDQFAVCRFLKDPTTQSENTPETHFFGVFDGHAGGKCSKAICTTIPYQFCRDESFLTKVPIALRKAIQRTNEQFLEVAGRMRLNDGSTAVCVVLRGLTMTISNVGDSRAVLISGKKGIPLTEDHKPSSPSEQKRIASFGGTVTYNTGIARVAGVLAVSRAFGNYSIRNLIRADPDITERELTSQDDFVVLASDGLWDVFSANEVAEVCYSWQRYGVNRIADQLVQLALTRGSMDNVTAIVVSLSKYISRMLQQQQSQFQSYNNVGNNVNVGNNNVNGNNNNNISQQSQSQQRAATASSVINASLRPDSGYSRRKNEDNVNVNGNNNNNNNNNVGREGIDQDKEDDDNLIGDDATITEYESTIIGISTKGSRSGTPSNDRKLTLLSTNFSQQNSNDSSTSFITPVQSKRSQYSSSNNNNNNNNNHNNNLSTIPLYTNNNNNNNNNNNMKKSSSSNNNNNNNNSLSTTLPLSTVPNINSNGMGGGGGIFNHSNHNNNNINNNNNVSNNGSSGTGTTGNLFSKTLGAKPDPPLERIYSPIISHAYRKGSLTQGNNSRPNTTR